MKIINDEFLPRKNVRRVLVELAPGEEITLATKTDPRLYQRAIDADGYYRLGEPMQTDVIAGHILADARQVTWDSLEQKWLDV